VIIKSHGCFILKDIYIQAIHYWQIGND